MIRLETAHYFLPTKNFRELSVLLCLWHNPDIRQQEIARQVGMSGAMVNGYIRSLRESGYVEVEKKNGRDLEYRLTSPGHNRLMGHLMNCSAEIVRLYTTAKEELVQRLCQAFADGKSTTVILFGGSETARLVVHALERLDNVKILAIVDNDKSKWGSQVGGYIVQSPVVLEQVDTDWVVVASFARQHEITELLQKRQQRSFKTLQLLTLQGDGR